MTQENIFIDGLIVKEPNEKAPDFVKGKISIKREDLIAYLQSEKDEWINADIMVSKGGKWYVKKNNFKKEEPKKQETTFDDYPTEEAKPDDIPF